MKDSDYVELIDLIYDAAVNPELWSRFLERFADVYRSHGTALFLHDFSRKDTLLASDSISFVRHIRFDDDYISMHASNNRIYVDTIASVSRSTQSANHAIFNPLAAVSDTSFDSNNIVYADAPMYPLLRGADPSVNGCRKEIVFIESDVADFPALVDEVGQGAECDRSVCTQPLCYGETGQAGL
jgi:hypothetical protein